MSFKMISSTAVSGFVLLAAQAVSAGEFGDQCAMGLALEKHFDTDCSINLAISGKTYCFGNEDAKTLFLEDTKGNKEKAEKYFASTQK